MFEIDGDPISHDRLDLAYAPIRLIGMNDVNTRH